MLKQGKVWGVTSPLFQNDNIEFHYAKINKGGYCSKHYHKTKFNRFVLIEGKLKVTIWNEYGYDTTLEDISILNDGDECIVPPGKYHQFEALENCILIEIYWVELSADDIVRANHGGMATNAKKTDICTTTTRENDSAGCVGSNTHALLGNTQRYPNIGALAVDFLGDKPFERHPISNPSER